MYKPPIEIFTMIENQVNEHLKMKNAKIEEHILQEVLRLGINVSKDDLIRALKNDREQYHAGFEDGKRYMLQKIKAAMGDISDIIAELEE